MSKTINLTFLAARQIREITRKFKAAPTMGDLTTYLKLDKILEEVSQEEQVRFQEIFARHGIERGQVLPQNDEKVAKLNNELNELLQSESSTPASAVQLYTGEELWKKFLDGEKSLSLAEQALVMDVLVKPKQPSKNKKQTQI